MHQSNIKKFGQWKKRLSALVNALRRIRRQIKLSVVWPTLVLCDYEDVLQAQNTVMIITDIAPHAPRARRPPIRGYAKPHLWKLQRNSLTDLMCCNAHAHINLNKVH